MNAESHVRISPSISGNTIDLGAGHSIALYERNRVSWVAEFRDGRDEFMYAGAWFRFTPEPCATVAPLSSPPRPSGDGREDRATSRRERGSRREDTGRAPTRRRRRRDVTGSK